MTDGRELTEHEVSLIRAVFQAGTSRQMLELVERIMRERHDA